ncbi:MAG: hypothetical protein ABF676_07980 [Schleiferilactobacillus harbinensis]|uniref:hypothetical protein n=1 Tax=Schleiferilactobacillus harbinensis TaxID=304207 RepID=UPI0039EC0F73
MKKAIITVLTASVLAGSALVAANTVTSVPVQAASTTTVKMASRQGTIRIIAAAGAQVYADTNFTQPIKGKVLPKDSVWRSYYAFGFDNAPAGTGYDLGGKQYVKAADIQTVTTNWAVKGIFTVNVQNHPTWATVLYNKDLKPIRSLPAQSKWTAYAMYQVYGQGGRYVDQYYDLGNQQYVKYVSFPTQDLKSGQYNGAFKSTTN